MVYRHKISDTDQPKQVLINSWAQLSQDTLNRAIDQLRQKDWRWLSRQRVVMMNFEPYHPYVLEIVLVLLYFE